MTHYHDDSLTIHVGDCRAVLPTLGPGSVQCCVTSPPYFGLRDYGHAGQIGLEQTPADYVAELVAVFREVRRVLKDDGTLWLNLGDSYATNGGAHGGRDDNQTGVGAKATHANGAGDQAPRRAPHGLKPKDLIGIPWRVAFALQADGWYLRQDIIWHKPNPMPESVTDRCTKAHEYVFMLSKQERYYYDAKAIAEPGAAGLTGGAYAPPGQAPASNARGTDKQRGHSRRHAGFNERWDAMSRKEQCSGTRNKRDVWTVATRPYSGAHFATMPPALVEPCILAGCPAGGTVLDPFGGSGTTAAVAERLGRRAVLIELNPQYVTLQRERTAQPGLMEVSP